MQPASERLRETLDVPGGARERIDGGDRRGERGVALDREGDEPGVDGRRRGGDGPEQEDDLRWRRRPLQASD